jgi:hypothetical protein
VFGRTGRYWAKERDMSYESWEVLADEVEISTGAAACWTCLYDAGE